ncbi:MAG TPA: dihydroxyacetone kinase subunit DhaK [Aggregatilineales bacterium]|nr:dihydroxyacetone kinase subunit DhaK [Aggregatilineales bacterium]
MTKVFNNPLDFREQMLDGFTAAYSRTIERIRDASGVMVRGGPTAGKVAVLIGGGGGHYPLFGGLVGKGFATGAVMGEIFTSPSAEQCYRCAKAVDGGAGIVFAYGNYSGDVMNFSMATMRLKLEGLDVRQVLVTDDVASSTDVDSRRGVAGDFFVFKVLGASAWRGDSLDTVEALGRRANAMTRSFGVAFGGCTVPGQGQPLFTVAPDQMELGLGLHGEPGVETSKLLTAQEVSGLLVDKLLSDIPRGAGTRAAVLVNGLGATKYEELFVLYSDMHRRLSAAGIETYKPIVGELATSLNMEGCSLTLMWLDKELQALVDAPAETPAWTNY